MYQQPENKLQTTFYIFFIVIETGNDLEVKVIK